MEFEERLQKAIQRGQRRGQMAAEEARARQLTEDELKRLHSQHRLTVSEHIEKVLHNLPAHFPGFRVESVFGERGWGAAAYRDDLQLQQGRKTSLYSRLEIAVRPISTALVLELAAKGTIRNKEAFSRSYYERLAEVDPDKFCELVDLWTLEYAEMYAAG